MLQKYFIAIVPPEPVLSQIQQLKQSISQEYKTKGALRSPGHITLHMPFSWEERKESTLISVLESFQFEDSFSIYLKNFNCFEPRVLFIDVLENYSLQTLQSQLVNHVKKNSHLFNQSDDRRGFHPHITVAFRDLKKAAFYAIWNEYSTKSFDAQFNCTTISLLKQEENYWNVFETFDFLKINK